MCDSSNFCCFVEYHLKNFASFMVRRFSSYVIFSAYHHISCFQYLSLSVVYICLSYLLTLTLHMILPTLHSHLVITPPKYLIPLFFLLILTLDTIFFFHYIKTRSILLQNIFFYLIYEISTLHYTYLNKQYY